MTMTIHGTSDHQALRLSSERPGATFNGFVMLGVILLAIAAGFAGPLLVMLVLPLAPDDRLPAGWCRRSRSARASSASECRRSSAEPSIARPLLVAFGLSALAASPAVSDAPAVDMLATATDSRTLPRLVHCC